MKLYRDEALVLRTQDLGEADRIITLLTRMHGRVRAVARGVRRTKSRFGARLEPFSLVDAQLYEGRGLDTITEVATLDPYGIAIGRDFDAYTAASTIAELAERLTGEEREPDQGQYLLLLGAIHEIAAHTHAYDSIVDSYALRAMALSGWALAIWDCARCGRPGPHSAFHVASGGMVCENCVPRGAAHPQPETVHLLGALLSGEWAAVNSAPEFARNEASGLIAAYVQWHIERTIRSLKVLNRA